MSIGILYDVFVTSTSGIIGLLVFFSLSKKRKKKKIEYSKGLDYFALLMGVVWILAGVRDFFTWQGRPEMNILIARWVSNPLIYIHVLPAMYYFTWSLFPEKKKVRIFLNGLFTVVVSLAVFTALVYGLIPGEVTPWGMKNEPNPITRKIFIYGIMTPGGIMIITDFIRRLKLWRKTKDPRQKQLFGFSLAFVIYLFAGSLENLFFHRTWLMLLVRIAVMISPMTLYYFITSGGGGSPEV